MHKTIAACLLIIAAASSSTIASAQTNTRRIEAKQMILDKKVVATSTGQMCAAINARIDNRLSSFSANYEQHLAAYSKHSEKLAQIAIKLEAEGHASDELKADITVLNAKIEQFGLDQAVVAEALASAKEKSCGASNGEFLKSIQGARDAQKVLALDARDIHDFIRNVIRQDIINISASLKAK